MSFAADEATRAAARLQASALLARIEQAKNKGQDYKISDIALLRRTCQAGGGVTVDTRTVGGRDAIYKAAVDAAVRRCAAPSGACMCVCVCVFCLLVKFHWPHWLLRLFMPCRYAYMGTGCWLRVWAIRRGQSTSGSRVE